MGFARVTRNFFFVAFCILAINTAARAQAPVEPLTTINAETATPKPGVGHDYMHMLGETVDPSRGQVTLHISLPTPSGRGITLPLSFIYNTAGLYHFGKLEPSDSIYRMVNLATSAYSLGNGWALGGLPYATGTDYQITVPVTVPVPNETLNSTCNYASAFSFIDPSGTSHNLGLGAMAESTSSQTRGTDHSQCPVGVAPVQAGADVDVGAQWTSPDCQPTYINTNGWGNCNTVNSLSLGNGVGGFTVTDKAGTTYTFNGGGSAISTLAMPAFAIEDRNGNQITIGTPQYNGNVGTQKLIDSVGRTTTISYSGSYGTTSPTTTQIALGGLSFQLNNTPASATNSYTANVACMGYVNGNPEAQNCDGTLATAATAVLMDTSVENVQSGSVVLSLPNSTSYKIYYGETQSPRGSAANPFGLINEIDYPDGGYVQYTWAQTVDYAQESNTKATIAGIGTVEYFIYYSSPVVTSRTVSYDGNTVAQYQTFSYTTSWPQGSSNWTAKSTTVNTTDSVLKKSYAKVYNYLPQIVTGANQQFTSGCWACQTAVESTVLTYNWGAGTSGNPARTETKTWQDDQEMLTDTTTLANGQSSEVAYTYQNSNPSFPNLIQEKDEFDFGNSLAGAGATSATRRTFYTYTGWFGTGATAIPPQTSSVVVKTGSGARMAETDYSYDQYTSDGLGHATLASLTGAAQHDDANYGASMTARANVTTAIKQCFVGSTFCTSEPVYYAYDMTGMPVSMTDGNGNLTRFSFADSYSDTTPSQPTNAYLTQIARPTTNGFAHVSSFVYRYSDGQLARSTDENGNATAYSYSDPLNRLTNVLGPAQSNTDLALRTRRS